MKSWSKGWEGGGWCERGVAVSWLGSWLACRGHRVIKYWQGCHLVDGWVEKEWNRGPRGMVEIVWVAN